MDGMAIPDCIQETFNPIQNPFVQPGYYSTFFTPPQYVADLSNFIHPFSEFKPERQRIICPTEKLITGEDNLTAFKQCYDGGSIYKMIEEHGFSPSQYLGLFFVSGLESASSMTATAPDKENLSLFLEWAYENRHSFDAFKSTRSIEKCLENKLSEIWSRTPETICLDKLQEYILRLDSYLDKLDMLNKLAKSKDKVQEFNFFKDINQSIHNYLQDNIDKIVNADLLFNTLKQKHQNRYAPSLFIDVFKFSEKRSFFEKDKYRQRRILELFSASYLKRDMNGTLDGHKSDLQKIYESLGGNTELFPYYEYIEKPSTEGTLLMRTRGFKLNSRKSGSGMTRTQIHKR